MGKSTGEDERARRMVAICAVSGAVLSSAELALRYAVPATFASAFDAHLAERLADATELARQRTGQGTAFETTFAAQYAPYLMRHFLDHAAAYLATTAVGFVLVAAAARRRRSLARVGGIVRIWSVLVVAAALAYLASGSSLIIGAFAVVTLALVVAAARRVRAQHEAPKLALASTASFVAVSVALLAAGSVAAPLAWHGTPAAVRSEHPRSALPPAQPLPAPSARGSSELASKLVGRWKLDANALLATPDMQRFIAQTPEPETTRRKVQKEAEQTRFTFRDDGSCERQDPVLFDEPAAKARLQRCTWRLEPRPNGRGRLTFDGREQVDVAFVGENALDLDQQRWIRVSAP